MDLLGFGPVDDLLLEVESNPTLFDDFVQKYQAATGTDPSNSDYLKQQPNKRWREYRIYFNGPPATVANLESAGYHVEYRPANLYYGQYAYRVNRRKVFWQLVQAGKRLGPN